MAFGVNPSRTTRTISQFASSDNVRGFIVNPNSKIPNNSLVTGYGKPNVNLGVNFTLNPKLALYMGANNSNASGLGDGGSGNSSSSGGDYNNGGGNKRPHKNKGKRNPTPSFQLEESSPLPVEWGTGIPTGLLYNYVQPGKSGFSPIYLSHGQLFPGNKKSGSPHSSKESLTTKSSKSIKRR